MDKIYMLNLTHGEYDDFCSTTIGFTKSYEEALLLQSALEAKEKEYIIKLNLPTITGFTLEQLINSCFDYGIDIITVHQISI